MSRLGDELKVDQDNAETTPAETQPEPSIYKQLRDLSRGTRSGNGFATLSNQGMIMQVYPSSLEKPEKPS